MMHMNTTGVTAPTGVATRAFALGTHSFGAFQDACVHTAG
jgi:hypothetical protein